MEKEIKRMDIKIFRENGYLQELNRRFLHPLGLALEVILDPIDGSEKLGGIWDYRQDKEGIYYDIANSDKERQIKFQEHAEFIDVLLASRCQKRKEKLGFYIEPIPENI